MNEKDHVIGMERSSNMDNLVVFKDYKQFKIAMDAEVSEAAAGFVRIGYLLKQARDTNIVQQAGFEDVNEFAKACYGLTRDMVSRYIDINDKYSEGGNSMELQQRYKAYGYSKLAEMLTLPDAIADEIAPSTTREEIRELKREYREEQKISDIEVMCEEPERRDEVILEDNLQKAVFALLEAEPELYEKLYLGMDGDMDDEEKEEKMLDILAPNGAAVHTARVPQVGRLMISIKENEQKIQLVNMRSGEKEEYFLSNLIFAIENTWPMESKNVEDAYMKVYGKPLKQQEVKEEKAETPKTAPKAKKTEIAPAQQSKNVKNTKEDEEKPGAAVTESKEPESEKITPKPIEKVEGKIVKTVEKKILPEFFRHIMDGSKTFEICKDEDNIQPGDTLILREWDKETRLYSGRKDEEIITYVLRDAEQYGLMPGYCIMCWG